LSVWNKQRREEEPSRPFNTTNLRQAPAAPPVETKKEATTLSSMSSMSSIPAGRTEPDTVRGGSATIGKAVKIVGQIFSREDLYVDGDVEGTIELIEHKLTVGPNGKVHAGVKAREVAALGTIQGNVDASDRIEIRKDAKLVGDIKTARIVIEDGAYFKGSIDIVKAEPKVAPSQARHQAAAGGAPSTPVPVSVPASAGEAKR
jgi:cytoskeletal protein CcmA (bactofilin family)